MSEHRAAYVRERFRRQRNSRPAHQEAEAFLPRHGVTIALEITVVLPVPMLDWPTNLFSEVHPMTNDDWAARHDHAGVAS
jgi:hypothetical protein